MYFLTVDAASLSITTVSITAFVLAIKNATPCIMLFNVEQSYVLCRIYFCYNKCFHVQCRYANCRGAEPVLLVFSSFEWAQ